MEVVLRAAAIISMCVNHIFVTGADGSAHFLMILAGFSFARFQLPNVLDGRQVGVLKALLIKVMLPFYAALVIILLLSGRYYSPNLTLTYSITPISLQETYPVTLLYFWFIESYILVTLFCVAIATIPLVQRCIRARPVASAATLYLVLESIRIFGVLFGKHEVFGSISPVMIASLFALGWLLFTLESVAHRLGVIVVAVLLMTLIPNPHFPHVWVIVGPALLLLVVVPSVRTGHLLGTAAGLIAASSFHIYMGHALILQTILTIRGDDINGKVLDFVTLLVSLAFGIAIQFSINALVNRWRGRSRANDALAEVA